MNAESRYVGTASGHTRAILVSTVIGTKVMDTSGNTIGDVKDVVLDKLSNNIMFAIVSFGGFLGIGEKYHPLPWSTLNYEPSMSGYVVSASKEQLQAAPADSLEELIRDQGVSYRDQAFDYYKAQRYW